MFNILVYYWQFGTNQLIKYSIIDGGQDRWMKVLSITYQTIPTVKYLDSCEYFRHMNYYDNERMIFSQHEKKGIPETNVIPWTLK
jgi:hypothetical protein